MQTPIFRHKIVIKLLVVLGLSSVGFTSIGMAEGDRLRCETLFGDAVQAWPRSDSWVERSFRVFDGSYSVTRHRPGDGVGSIFFVKIKKFATRPPLLRMALRYPDFFRRFDIVASANENFGGETMTVPDSARLNWLRLNKPNGLKAPLTFEFQDRPVLKRQPYSDSEFFSLIRERKVVLATRGGYFGHDRFEEHLAGALLMPDFIANGFVALAHSLEAADQKPWSKQIYFKQKLPVLKDELGSYWDQITSRIGYTVDHQEIQSRQNLKWLQKQETKGFQKQNPVETRTSDADLATGISVSQWVLIYTRSVEILFELPETQVQHLVDSQVSALTFEERRQARQDMHESFEGLRRIKPTANEIETAAMETYSELSGRSRAVVADAYMKFKDYKKLASRP